MKRQLIPAAFLLLAGCAATGNLPPTGNVSAKDYQHVSGVYSRRSAAAEAAVLVGTAGISAAAGGTPVSGNSSMRTYTAVVPDANYTLPAGCELLSGEKP